MKALSFERERRKVFKFVYFERTNKKELTLIEMEEIDQVLRRRSLFKIMVDLVTKKIFQCLNFYNF